jgi:twitching motility two-component system response regulator PilH
MGLVLVVDDVKTERDLIGKVVSTAGHRAEFAADGEEAVTKVKTLKPSLVVMDVVMPKQDGFATCRKLKKDDETKNIPIVLVTSKNQESDKFWGERQGCDAYVTKPFNPSELADLIKKFAR